MTISRVVHQIFEAIALSIRFGRIATCRTHLPGVDFQAARSMLLALHNVAPNASLDKGHSTPSFLEAGVPRL